MDYEHSENTVLHWNYRGFTEFPLQQLQDGEGDITDIYLKENLISRIPSDIGKLRNLESLYLSGNDITELPREISKLSRLKCLDISGNRLRFIPDEIGEMRSLKYLILDENELRQLPLRIAELRTLRYLSVCDNKLEWLPQQPVYNYHHCELRFWRNPTLKTIPYSLWYHMFRGQQTRSFNIACLGLPRQNEPNTGRLVIKINQDSREISIEVNYPTNYNHVLHKTNPMPPTLLELSKRKLYDTIWRTGKRISDKHISLYSDYNFDDRNENNNYIDNLQDYFQEFNINKNIDKVANYNNILNSSDIKSMDNNLKSDKNAYKIQFKDRRKRFYVPSDFVDEYFYYLPIFLKNDLCNGPISRCENVLCKKPVFNYAYFEFCIEKLILIDNTEDVILSAVFCSKSCADTWRNGKTLLEWNLER